MCDIIPKRVIVLAICVSTNAAIFALRSIFPITMLAMSAHSDWQRPGGSQWSAMTQGWLLAAFFIGHLLGMLPFGWLVRRCGTRFLLCPALLLAGICTCIVPHVPANKERAGSGVGNNAETWVFLMRAISGLGCSATMPSIQQVLRVWLGPQQQQAASQCITSFGMFGIILGILVAGLCTQFWRWQGVYYMFGGFCIFCGLLYAIGVHDRYEYYPGISVTELRVLRSIGAAPMPVPVPWLAICSSCPVWSIWLAQLGHGAFSALVALLLPRFMQNVQKMALENNTYYQTFIWLVLLLSVILMRWLERYMLSSPEKYSDRIVRVLFTTIGCVPAALVLGLIIGLPIGENWTLMSVLALAMFCKAASFYGFWANVFDLTDNFAGEVVGVANAVGIACAIAMPLVWGATVTDMDDRQQYDVVFYGTCGLLLAGNVLYAVMSSGDPQWWDGLTGARV